MILRLQHRLPYICGAVLRGAVRCFIYSMLALPISAVAQTETDTLGTSTPDTPATTSAPDGATEVKGDVPPTEEPVAKSPVADFRPSEVAHQKRYRPTEGDTLFTKVWWRRIYAGAGAGFQALSDNIGTESNLHFMAYLGYRFDPVHSLRVHASYTNFKFGEYNRYSAKSVGLGIDYLANLTNFAWGYNRERFLDVSSLVGFGSRVNSASLNTRISPYAYLGAHIDLHLSSMFALFAEPYVGMHRKVEALFQRTNPEPWDLMYGVNAGLMVMLDRRTDHYTEADSIYRHAFFDTSMGIAMMRGDGGLMHRLGNGYQASVGVWLNPMMGLRLGAQAQNVRWFTGMTDVRGASMRQSETQALLSGRAEIVLNPLNFSKKRRNKKGGHNFDINLLFGGDFGWNVKANVPNTTNGTFRTYYYGATAAVQALYRVAKPGTYIFVEPRYLAAMYSIPYQNTHNSKFTSENSFSLNVGTRVYIMPDPESLPDSVAFTPRWWTGLDFGGVKVQRTSSLSSGGIGFNPTVGLSFGYDWKRYASFRAQVAYQALFDTHSSSYVGYDANNSLRRGSGMWDSYYHLLDLRLAYMLNLNNLVQGYNPNRRFNLWLTGGPAISAVMGQSNSWVEGQQSAAPQLSQLRIYNESARRVTPAVHASLMAALRLSPHFDLTVESMGQYNLRSHVNPGDHGRINSLKYVTTVGTRYYFNQDALSHFFRGTEADSLSTSRHFFFDSSLGYTTAGKSGGVMHRAGHSYQAAIGMWLNPILGFRVGLQAQSIRWRSSMTHIHGAQVRQSDNHALVGGRVEVLLNPLNFSKSRRLKQGGHDFDLNLLLGADLGLEGKGNMPSGVSSKQYFYGFTGALQALYRIANPGTYIFFEPRYMATMYGMPYFYRPGSHRVRKHNLSLSVGTRIALVRDPAAVKDSVEYASRWWAGLDFGGVKVQRASSLSSGGIGFNPTVGLSFGYDWKRYASFRAQVAYQALFDTHSSSYVGYDANNSLRRGSGLWDSSYHLLDLRLAYMLNLNTLLQGYNPNRRFNLWLTGGPAVSAVVGQSNSWVVDQKVNMPEMAELHVRDNRSGNVSPAVHASLMAAMRLSSQFDVTVEAMGQCNFLGGVNPGNRSRINSIKYVTTVGTRYYFSQDALKNFFTGSKTKPWQKGWELSAAYGWAMPLDVGMGLRASGSNMTVSAGYWFNSLLGVRLGFMGQQTYYCRTSVPAVFEPISGMQTHAPYSIYASQYMLGARAELTLNPLNFSRDRRDRNQAPRWDMNLSAGVNFGAIGKVGAGVAGGYVGFTTSASMLYRLDNVTQLYLEPRYDVYNFDKHNDALDVNQGYADRMFTLSVGARVMRPVDESSESRRPTSFQKMAHRGWWAQVGLGGSKMLQLQRVAAAGRFIQPSFNLSAGYDLNRLSSARVNVIYNAQSRMCPSQPYTVAASGITRSYRGTVNNTIHQLDLQALYMLNLTNLWTGYDKRGKFNIYFQCGPAISVNLAQSNSLAKGEMQGGTDFRYQGRDYAGKLSFGLASGMFMALPITSHWDITSELMGHFYFAHGMVPEYRSHRLNDIKMNFSIGTRYNF